MRRSVLSDAQGAVLAAVDEKDRCFVAGPLCATGVLAGLEGRRFQVQAQVDELDDLVRELRRGVWRRPLGTTASDRP